MEKKISFYVFAVLVLLLIQPTEKICGQKLCNHISKKDSISFCNGIENSYNDTTINAGKEEILIQYESYGSGLVRININVFIKCSNTEDWIPICTRRTNTSRVRVSLDQQHGEIIFKSKSGKILMIMPVETMSLDFDAMEF